MSVEPYLFLAERFDADSGQVPVWNLRMTCTNLFQHTEDLLLESWRNTFGHDGAERLLVRTHTRGKPHCGCLEVRRSVCARVFKGTTGKKFQYQREIVQVLLGVWKHPSDEWIADEGRDQ